MHQYDIALIVLDVLRNYLEHILPLINKIKEYLLTIEVHEIRIVQDY